MLGVVPADAELATPRLFEHAGYFICPRSDPARLYAHDGTYSSDCSVQGNLAADQTLRLHFSQGPPPRVAFSIGGRTGGGSPVDVEFAAPLAGADDRGGYRPCLLLFH